MIKIISHLFKEISLLNEVGELPFYVSFNRNFNFFVFGDREEFYQVKVSSERPLRGEYEALRIAHQAIPGNVPQPVGLYQKAGLEILICRGIRHKKVRSLQAHRDIVQKEIKAILKTSKVFFREEKPSSPHTQQLMTVFDYFKNHPLSIAMQDWLRNLNPRLINSLPHIKQHGDLTLYNMGVARNKLIIFDWEDFGKITIPGFDLCCLAVNSVTRFSPMRIERISERSAYPKEVIDIIACYCEELPLDQETFFSLYPIYLFYFLYLKDRYGYSPEIIKIGEKLLAAVLEKPMKC
jgi:hypothetical protein